MKKLIIHTLLVFYLFSFAKPFAPAIFNSISKYLWEVSHKKAVEKMDGRVNLLVVLADMAKHNSPKSNNTPQPDTYKASSGSFLSIVSKYNYNFALNEITTKYFSHNSDFFHSVFQKYTTPPPKVA